MSEENTPHSELDVIVIIDKDKLPEELRDKLPQDLQNKLIALLQEKTITSPASPREKQSSNLFAVQNGTVVGNIYKDGIFSEEKPVHKKKIKEEGSSEYPKQEVAV